MQPPYLLLFLFLSGVIFAVLMDLSMRFFKVPRNLPPSKEFLMIGTVTLVVYALAVFAVLRLVGG